MLVIIFTLMTLVLGMEHPRADRTFVDMRWEDMGSLPDDFRVLLSVATRAPAKGLAELEKFVDAASDPKSDMYGKWLNGAEASRFVSPSRAQLAAIEGYFAGKGARVTVRSLGSFVDVELTAGQARRGLGVDFHRFRHRKSGREVARTFDAFHVPDDLAVEVVTGLSEFFENREEKRLWREEVAARMDAPPAQSSPEVVSIQGSQAKLEFGVKLWCHDGKAASNADEPCAGHAGGALSSFSVFLEAPAYEFAVEMTVGKFPDSRCAASNGAVVCELSHMVPHGARVKVSAQSTFTGGDKSEVGGYAGPFYTATPWVTPRLTYERYGVPESTSVTNPKSSTAIASFERQYASPKDLAEFFAAMGLAPPRVTFYGDNDYEKYGVGGESTLDLQWATSIGRGTNFTYWYSPRDNHTPLHGGYILTWAMQMLDDPNPPYVTSISYGDTESDYLLAFGNYSYIYAMEARLLTLASMGRTVLAGSGDAGATNVGERGNDLGHINPDCSTTRAFYPSDSPWVTSTSATFLTTFADPVCGDDASPGGFPIICEAMGEAAVSVSNGVMWTTGGSFSNLLPRPAWQDKAVKDYFALASPADLPPSGLYNASGRGYSDLGLLGHNLIFRFNGQWDRVGGTSASGPIGAGLITLLNDIRFNLNKGPLGPLNKMLYQAHADLPACFNDVVVGENSPGDVQPRGSPYPTYCPGVGYSTLPNWDPVTGLGSINFPILVSYIESLP